MTSILLYSQSDKSHSTSNDNEVISPILYGCNCHSAQQPQNLESIYYENLSSASYEQSYNSQQIIPKNEQIQLNPVNNNNNQHQNHRPTQKESICIIHSQNLEIIAKMEKDLLLNEEYKQKFYASSKVRASKNEKPICGQSLKDVISYHCFDCFEDRKAVICEQCFDLSDHYGHRYYSQKEPSGLCDCGDQEILHPNAKVGCALHKGKANSNINLKEIDQEFLKRAETLIPEWFKIIFESAELFLIKRDPQISEFQNKIMNCAFKVIQSLGANNDIVLSKAISDILIKNGNNYSLYHDCDDYENKIPIGSNLAKKECSCNIIELIFRFAMYPCFGYETQGFIRQNLIDLMGVQSFKVAYAKAFIKMFRFLFSVDLGINVEYHRTIQNNFICLTYQEIFTSYELNLAVYETGQVRQLFLSYLNIAKLFNNKKHIGDQKSKQVPYQYFYYFYISISGLLKKEKLFDRFLEEPELFDILLQAQSNLQAIIEYNHKIYMPEQSNIEKNTYLLFYRLTGQLNIFKIIANHFILKLNNPKYHDALVLYIKKSATYIQNYYTNQNQDQMEGEEEKKTTYYPLERTFIYLFYAYFLFDLENVNQANLSNLTKLLGYTDEETKNLLMNILKRVLQSISIYQEVHNKMWVFNGEEFESHIKQYTNNDFELKVVDSMFVKIVTKLYSIDDILQQMPQNPFTSSLVQFKQEKLMEEYSNKEKKIEENAQNMVQKSLTSFSCFLNFISYNVCSELDEIYFKCIQNCQTATEIGEDIILQSSTYFATLFNGLSNSIKDIKSLGELYQQDFGKRAPVQQMYQKVCTNEIPNTVTVLKAYENIYEPLNFTFNYDAQSKYYGAIEVNKNVQIRIAMILGNVPIKKDIYIQIGKNTVNVPLLKYLQQFLNNDYNLKLITKNLQFKESILYSILKLMTIFMQVQPFTNECNDALETLLQQVQSIMSEDQFLPLIQHVMQIKSVYAKDTKENQSAIEEENIQAREESSETKFEQRRKEQILRQQEILKKMQSQQNKVKQMYFENTNTLQQLDEECCFCKQQLIKSPHGVLVSIQKNTFYQDQEIKSIINNLKQSKNGSLTQDRLEEIKDQYYQEQRNNPDMLTFSTCDHKIHKQCYEENVNKAQLSKYEQLTKDIEIKCQICKQYKNFFLEINNNIGFEEEKFQNKKKEQNNHMNCLDFNMDMSNNLFSQDYDKGFNSFHHNQFDHTFQNFGFTNEQNMFDQGDLTADPFGIHDFGFDTQPKKQMEEEDNDDEFKEIIYKKVKKNNDEAQFKESQQHQFQRMEKIYKFAQNEKEKLHKQSDYLKYNQSQMQKQSHHDEQNAILHQRTLQEIDCAIKVYGKHIANNEIRSVHSIYNFNDILSKPSEQFIFYERSFYNQIRYFDLANKRPDDDTTILKIAAFLFQQSLNSYSFINDYQTRYDFIQKRLRYCQYFEELIQTGNVNKFDEKLVKGLPYLLKKDFQENNLSDAYTQYLIFQFCFQFSSQEYSSVDQILNKTLPLVLKKFALQTITSQHYLLKSTHKYQLDNEDDIEDLSSFLLRLTRRAVITTILFKKNSSNDQSNTFDQIFKGSTQFDSEISFILKYFNLKIHECLPTQSEIDSLENSQGFQSLNNSIDKKPLKQEALPLLLISTTDSFSFELINIPNDYLEYSKTIYKKKCHLCNRIPLISELMQCLICGELICFQSCTQSVSITGGSLNKHANICHGGQAIYINTQSGQVTVISSPHNTNSLKQPLRKQVKCDWKQFFLLKNVLQNLKKQLYENNTRNLIMEDHQQRQDKNIQLIGQYCL